jgi:hypothetical protein
MATHDVCPPYLTKSGPGAGVEPRTPSSWILTGRSRAAA